MESKEASAPGRLTTKEVRSEIEQQLEKALIGWKEELGEKRFRKRIRKAGKLFGKKLKRRASKPKAKKKDAAKQKMPKQKGRLKTKKVKAA